MQTEATGFNFIMTKSHHFVDEIVRNEHQMMVRVRSCLAKSGQQKAWDCLWIFNWTQSVQWKKKKCLNKIQTHFACSGRNGRCLDGGWEQVDSMRCRCDRIENTVAVSKIQNAPIAGRHCVSRRCDTFHFRNYTAHTRPYQVNFAYSPHFIWQIRHNKVIATNSHRIETMFWCQSVKDRAQSVTNFSN